MENYLDQKEITAYTADGNEKIINPVKEDLKQHRSYQFQDLTARGTVEFRSVCTQPLETTFAPIAFELGLFVELEKLENYLEECSFLKMKNRTIENLERNIQRKI